MKKLIIIIVGILLPASAVQAAGVMTFFAEGKGGGYMPYHTRNEATVLLLYGKGKGSIDWGDGTPIENITLEPSKAVSIFDMGSSRGEFKHTYEGRSTDTYTITVTGDVDELSCKSIALLELDVSGNPALKKLECQIATLASLDVSRNPALEELICGGTGSKIVELDVSRNRALKKLHCSGGALAKLNVSGCAELMLLRCNGCQLTSLDVSSCTSLMYLRCFDNPLTALDVSRCPCLALLECGQTQITQLDVSNNFLLGYLVCTSAKLSATALRELLESLNNSNALPTRNMSKSIAIGKNPGTAACNHDIATAKGWELIW